MKVSKNISRGEEITDLREIKRLALNRESVVMSRGQFHWVRPAAFILGWPLNEILNTKLFYSIKENGPNKTDKKA
jgi:hypothetical protein